MQILSNITGGARRVARVTMVAATAVAMAACGSTETLLEVQDPDIINPADVTTAAAANALRLGALARLNGATTGGESTFLLGGLLADEYRSADTFTQRNETDFRVIQPTNANTLAAFRTLYRARLSATQGVEQLTKFNAASWQIAQMYFIKAFVENQLAQDFCGHIPFSTVVEGREQLGNPLTTQAAFELALASVDSALALVQTGTAAEVATYRNAASVLRGRILLNLGRAAEAATAVAAVPTTFRFFLEHSANTGTNATWSLNNNIGRWYVGNGEGGNGLDFTADSRVPTCRISGTNSSVAGTKVGCASDTPATKPFDPATPVINNTTLIIQQKWTARYDSMSILTGFEARLIEAEALVATNPAGALAKLNELRATRTGLAPLTDAGSTTARVTQLFNERAYWLFGMGTRLGDLRRLIRQYNRPANTVFPTGAYWKPTVRGEYGPDVNIPVPQAEENNPNFVRASCVSTQA